LADEAEVRLPQLAKEPLILPARGTGNRLLIDETLARQNAPLRWSFEVNRTATALDLVSGGVGIAFLPASSLDGVATPGVVSRPVADMIISRPVGILTRRGKVESRGAAALRSCIVDVATLNSS